MKKFIFSLVAFVSMTAGMYAQSEGEETQEPKDPPLIELRFGRKSLGCTGFGICKFAINITKDNIGVALQLITVFLRDGQLGLEMSPEYFSAHSSSFQNGYLVMDEDFTLDSEVTKAFKLEEKYTIKTGRYKVEFNKEKCSYSCVLSDNL